ncbi:hypothetical protein [Zhouia amylolytica]|uniref:hypothetical protein n=1 Tax=Zhouia amylolytica TaxID=376730 RepID=UPI0020CD83ED|nr:hypothetical protein [Zhouia amylolytica]MCQ0113130.1 hypothetical protein [Zhouia amylolytica]
MEFYNLENAQTIVEYYSPILIGLSIEPPNNYPITSIEIQEYEGNQFRVICRVAEHAGATIIDDVASIAERHNIILPSEVLENEKLI